MRRSRHRSHAALAVLVLIALLAPVVPARADTGLGEAWEEGIQQGIERQERERKQRQPDSILRDAKLLAGRPSDGAQKVVRTYLLARAYAIAGDVASARRTYAEVLRLAPRCYFAPQDLAMLDLQQEPADTAAAERNLRQAIQMNPGYLTAQRKLAMLMLREDKPAEALSYLERIVGGDPSDLQARFYLVQALLQTDHLDEAEKEVATLLQGEPNNPAFQSLRAEVWTRRGRYDDAREAYRRLSLADPAQASYLAGFLRCLDEQREKQHVVDFEGYIWALEGLSRLERDPARKKQIAAALEEVRKQQAISASGAETDGPPTDAQMAVILPNLETDRRLQVLRYVYARDDAPEVDLLTAVIARLAPKTEPVPEARMYALRILGRFGGFGLVGLVRHSLRDPSPEVRPIAADVLVDLARTRPAAHGAAVLALGLVADGDDAGLASAARAGIQELTKAQWPVPDDADEGARRAAFRAWWSGSGGAEAKVQALERFPEIGDLDPESVLLPYLADTDAFVVGAAWTAMSEMAKRLVQQDDAQRGEPGGHALLGAARRTWLAACPAPPAHGAKADAILAAKPALDAWLGQRP